MDGRNLNEMCAGEGGSILFVQDGPDADALKALGLCSGQMVRVIRDGDPMIVDLFGTKIAIAASLAAQVCVSDAPAPFCGCMPAGDEHV